jgi:hypothetical protein
LHDGLQSSKGVHTLQVHIGPLQNTFNDSL